MSISVEEQVGIVQQYTGMLQRQHLSWDVDDLEGQILEMLTRYPVAKESQVRSRIVWTKADWSRQILGRTRKSLTYETAVVDSLDRTVWDHYGDNLTLGDTIPGESDVQLDSSRLSHDFLEKFDPVDQTIMQLLVEGHIRDEIAKVIEISASAVSQRIKRFSDKVHYLLCTREDRAA